MEKQRINSEESNGSKTSQQQRPKRIKKECGCKKKKQQK
jgi:hypothetical protein